MDGSRPFPAFWLTLWLELVDTHRVCCWSWPWHDRFGCLVQFPYTLISHKSTNSTSHKQIAYLFDINFHFIALVINQDGQGYQYEDDTDEDEEQAEFEDQLSEEIEEHQRNRKQRSQSRSSQSQSNEPKIRKKKRRNVSASSDDDTAPKRKPLSQAFHHNRKKQRLQNHPMAPTTRTKRTNPESEDDDDETVSARQQLEDQVEELREEAKRLKKRAKLAATVGSKKVGNGKQMSAMSREVCKKTKTDLWPVKKFIYNDEKLIAATKFVLKRLGDLVEFDGMRGDSKMEAEETWLAMHKEDVRTSLNNVRNFVQQELRKLVIHHYDTEQEDLLPTVPEILKLLERKGLASGNNKVRMEAVFDFYWDKLLPKVAGHVNWCPTKRHYSLLSTATTPSPIEGEADIPCVHHTSEGILVALWEHCFPRWSYECIQKRTKKDVDPKHADMQGKDYISAIAGRNKYGGWTKIGRERVKALSAMCKAARKKPSLEAIERDALQRLRYVSLCPIHVFGSVSISMLTILFSLVSYPAAQFRP